MKNLTIIKLKKISFSLFLTLIIIVLGSKSSAYPFAKCNSGNFCNRLFETDTTLNKSQFAINCKPNTFYAIANTDSIEELQINGGVITSNGTKARGIVGHLAVCNNLNGSTASPTFYNFDLSTHYIYFYDGNNWIPTSNFTNFYPTGIGGGNGYLYFNTGSKILSYNGTNMNTIFTFSSTTYSCIADLACDSVGNIWLIECNQGTTGSHSTFVDVISTTGQLLKQYPLSIDITGAYGCFLLNGIFYLGFNNFNPVYPNNLLPISFNGSNTILGNPMSMGTQYGSDLASCTPKPGLPPLLNIDENNTSANFILYPIPSSNKLHLINHFNDFSEYTIYTIYGKAIVSKIAVLNNTEIDISSFPEGVYVMEVNCKGQTQRMKFIKREY